MQENFTAGRKVIAPETFKILIPSEWPTVELIVYFDWFLNIWTQGNVLTIYQKA